MATLSIPLTALPACSHYLPASCWTGHHLTVSAQTLLDLLWLPPSGASGTSAPLLAKGADDIYWVHQLHVALTAHGYYPDDDEAADWFFGDHTASAVISFQACVPLVIDAASMRCLHLRNVIPVLPTGAATAQR